MTLLEPLQIRPGPEHLFFRNASWEFVQHVVTENPTRRFRLSYDRGRLYLMSPLPIHDKWQGIIGRFVETAAEELALPMASFGSTTWIREDVARGIESDESYYIINEPSVRGRMDIDLSRDPPPDLVIEVDVTHSPIDRESIYAALGVSEMWVFNGRTMRFLKLQDGAYAAVDRSVSFPFVSPGDIESHLALLTTTDETTLVRRWRAWVRANGLPG